MSLAEYDAEIELNAARNVREDVSLEVQKQVAAIIDDLRAELFAIRSRIDVPFGMPRGPRSPVAGVGAELLKDLLSDEVQVRELVSEHPDSTISNSEFLSDDIWSEIVGGLSLDRNSK